MAQSIKLTIHVPDTVESFPAVDYEQLYENEAEQARKLSKPMSALRKRGVQRPNAWIELIQADRPVIANASGELEEPQYENYELVQFLGKGAQGKATVYVNKKHNIDVVFKFATGSSSSTNLTEVDDFLRARKDNMPISIVRQPSAVPRKRNATPTVRISEHCELGDLKFIKTQYMANQEQVPEERVWYVLKQISLVLAYLHEGVQTEAFGGLWKPIWHRDLKLSNIFLAKPAASAGIFVEWEPKLGNFNCAKYKYECTPDEPLDDDNDVYELGSMICMGRSPGMTYEMNEFMYDQGLLRRLRKGPPDSSPQDYCDAPIPVSHPNEEPRELGIALGEGGYSEALDKLLEFVLHPTREYRYPAAKLYLIASKVYDVAAFKAKSESPESIIDFQEKFATTVNEWGLNEILMWAADADEELAEMRGERRGSNQQAGDAMDLDDDERQGAPPRVRGHGKRVRWADDVKGGEV
jgi:serine/threonine protein kinase